MNEQEQRIAIAEACGRNGWWCPQCKKLVSEYSLGYQNRHQNCSESAQQAPNYTRDLNAMHEAEKTLTQEQWLPYLHSIYRLCPSYREGDYWYERFQTQKEVATATAAQRAEAFLRTIGKWKEAAK